ncbi:MAG TPA: head GIN domain-containing protein [Cyclobacteriaceae bacterium]|nr:head GIN domain-containing protein [Cyclobacteriaceae bacterium]
MKRTAITLLFVFGFVLTWAQTKETRNVDTFTKLNFRVPGKLYLRQGNEQKVVLEGPKEVLEKIETEVSGSRLSIGRESEWRSWNWDSNDRIIVYVTVKNIEGISVSGSGNLIGEGVIKAGDLALAVSGSGSMEIEVNASGYMEANVSGSGNIRVKGNCRAVESKVSGSGKVMLASTITERAEMNVSGSGRIIASGTAKEIRATISGSGEVQAADLEVEKCEVRISGSGDVEINVKQALDATISGSGSVSYRGNPSQVNSHSSGSGKVRKM